MMIQKVFSASDLLASARNLHDNLVLFEFDEVLMSEISCLCEEWWKEDLAERETMISLSMPLLLSRSLTLKKKVDVHRVYALREAFTCFDFDDESIEDLKRLLLRCYIEPLYLKTDDGKKFLSFLFELDRQLVKEALVMIRSQISTGRKSTLEAYAEIVFKAWKVVEDEESMYDIEDRFLQELIDSCIHASSGQFSAYIRRILGGFISQRTNRDVDKLLFRLTEPLIFRSLEVANSNVRQNTLFLLLDMFPLQDPDMNKEGNDLLLEKQFYLLDKLLTDECPATRVVAVEGSCRVLHLFWEIITSSTITKFLAKIFDDMTKDTSKEVRLAALDGIMFLLGNPQSHEVLRVLLPRAGHLVSDASLSVRSAAVDLLLLISGIRNFQFHKVAQLDVLLLTLANDQPLVARKITKLLMPSYFPSTAVSEEACKRCVTLIKRSPKAGARFCEFAYQEGASLESIMELFKHIIGLALSRDHQELDQINAFIDASAFLCQNLASEPYYNGVLKQEVCIEKLKHLFVSSSTGRACSSLCKIVSVVSPDGIDSLTKECMPLVTNCSGLLSGNVETEAEVRSVHKMMLACDRFDYMFETLAKLLGKFANACHLKYDLEMQNHDFPSTKQRKTKSFTDISGKRKKTSPSSLDNFEKDYAIAAGISWQIKDMLIFDDTRKAVLESGAIETALSSLKVISEVSIMQTEHCDYVNVHPLLAYTALALHMSFKGINKQGTRPSNCSGSSSSEQTLLEQTLNHLLSSSSKLLDLGNAGKSKKLPRESTLAKTSVHSHGKKKNEVQTDVSSPAGEGSRIKRLANMVKMLSAVLKFIIDVSAVEHVDPSQPRFLNFTLGYLEFISSIVLQYSQDQQQLRENDLKETFLCLKSSFTYASKLLHEVITYSCETTIPSPEAYTLSNKLLDLLISVEEHMGSSYATRIVAAAKPWLPDLTLGIGYWNILRQSSGNNMSTSIPDYVTSTFPSWLKHAADAEVAEISQDVDDGAKMVKYPAFRKLIEVMIQLFKANHELLDAVGVIFLMGSVFGLEKRDFKLVLGLVHFVCAKLVRHDNVEWDELNLMLEYLKEIYPQIEREAEFSDKLQSARELLEPIWLLHNHGSGRTQEEE
ncbi:uncharacterized protein LOC141719474 isoform X2 [Apium graveolens]|uniref:uncharacterized protein LOC141719474 isoform X2 n=1 Tax=Apium graveolens TaxID=4045 RepID=UPI003D78B6B9